jgi:hypothetical protein
MLFAYTLNSCITLYEFQKLIGNTLAAVANAVIGSSPFESVDKVVITPFSSTTLLKSLMEYDYSLVIADLNRYPKQYDAQIANYNWFDLAKVLHGPDLQRMKDVESQYYYISGALQYKSMIGEVESCIEDVVTIDTWSGAATFSYVRNAPCREQDSYVGPVDYVKFYRVFNDGPPSSGYFDTGVTDFYVKNDKAQLETGEYITNSHSLFDTSGVLITADVFTDGNGRYDLINNGDYLNQPLTWGCTAPPQRMHIGDNLPRTICSKGSCVCTLQTVTGWKYVAVELPEADWNLDIQFRQTAPISDVAHIRRRAWAISENPYVATAEGDTLMPYWVDNFSIPHWYVGYPVLNGSNAFPELAFFQWFDNTTFNEQAGIVIYPSISSGAGTVGEGVDVTRTYQTSTGFLFSGVQAGGVDFLVPISANMSGKDSITKKFFGMGTAFSGKYDIHLTQEENAGFFYTGFVVFETGQLINAVTLADGYSDSIIGQFKTIKYITGYTNIQNNGQYEMSNRYGFDGSGNAYTFAYFDSDIQHSIPQNGWSYFCPEPAAFPTDSYTRMFGEQKPESYFPRYFEGPYSVETRKFLYPNMVVSDRIHEGKTHGVPMTIRFTVDVREETVREIFCKYNIYPDGGISNPEYIRVLRSDVVGQNNFNPFMTHIFKPNDGSLGYDFNLWATDTGIDNSLALPEALVDNNWAPKISGKWVPKGRNSNTYLDDNAPSALFHMGVKKKYNGAQNHVIIGKTGSYVEYQTRKPRSDGLFHGYKAYSTTGSITYVLPIFDLTKNSVFVSDAMNNAFPDVVDHLGILVGRYDGTQDASNTGEDPLFFEYVGGRRGSDIAKLEGGYHSKGIIGDRWLGETKEYYGIGKFPCSPDGEHTYYTTVRLPVGDSRLLLFNTDATGTDLWMHGMAYTPFATSRNSGKLSSSMKFPYSIDNNVHDYLTTWDSGDYVNFNIAQLMPARPRTGILQTDDEWYAGTGLILGPFDRDVEVGIVNGQRLMACSELYINGDQLTHYFQDSNDCDRNWLVGIGRDRYIENNSPYFNTRSDRYSIITIVPSGRTVAFNILSRINSGDWPPISAGDISLSQIGISGSVILSMKTHVPLDADDYDSYFNSGEYNWHFPDYFVNNGVESKLRLQHTGPENIGSRYEFVIISQTGKLYYPPGNDFTGMASWDGFGNPTYGLNATPETYWRNYAIRSGQTITFSGYREGTRISVNIRNVSVDYDVVPYQTYKLVSPSGDCYLSGKFGYFAQADNCVFSEGVYLVNATAGDELAEIYNPSYVSDVLKRIPSGLFPFPVTQSGHETEPVLVAPSVMKQREDQSVIAENQKYTYLLKTPPYNYNKLLWPALSDLETLNPGETIENIPGGDGDTFTDSTLTFSAAQGQALPNGAANPNIVKSYYVQNIFQMYDSVATDAYINSGQCITSGVGTSVFLTQLEMSGALVPLGTSLALIKQGLV